MDWTMKVALRNALAELLLEALRSPERAAVIRLVLAYCLAVEGRGGFQIPLHDLDGGGSEEGSTLLASLGLFQFDGGFVELLPEFQADLPAIRVKAEAYLRALSRIGRDEREGLERALQEAAVLFNEGLYFEVHEHLERFWMSEEDPVRRRFLQGLIQIAAAFHHLSYGNFEGAVSLLQIGSEKLKGLGPSYLGVELEGFLKEAEACRETVQRLGRQALAAFDRAMIPRMGVGGERRP